MTDALEINLVGRIMLGASRHGLAEPARVCVMARAIAAVIRHRYPEGRPGLRELEPLISDQLAMLETALNEVPVEQAPEDVEPPPEMIDVQRIAAPEPGAAAAQAAAEEPRRIRQRTLRGRGHTVVAKPMGEKLQSERAPVQELLRGECVNLGLLDGKQAEKMVRRMVGKSPAEGEQMVVETLRQTLQDQVKGIIRRLKGGPWATPQSQEAMRQDIHNTRSVRSIIMLAKQVRKERHTWELEHGRGGMLSGLFG